MDTLAEIASAAVRLPGQKGHLTEAQEETIVAMRIISSILSLLGSAFMIFSMIYFKRLDR